MGTPDYPIIVMAAAMMSLITCTMVFSLSPSMRKATLTLVAANALAMICCFVDRMGVLPPPRSF